MQNPKYITPIQAIKLMRELTEQGVPFAMSFIAYNSTKAISNGLKVVHKATLRKGLRNDQSNKAHTLIAYTDYSLAEKPRFFHLGLLLTINDFTIKP